MIIQCPQCSSAYDIPNAAAIVGRKVRCTSCAHVWRIEAEAAAEPPQPAVASEPAEPVRRRGEPPPPAEQQATAPVLNGAGGHGASADPRDADMLGSESDEAEAASATLPSLDDGFGVPSGPGEGRGRQGLSRERRNSDAGLRYGRADLADDLEPGAQDPGRPRTTTGRRLAPDFGSNDYSYNGYGTPHSPGGMDDAGLGEEAGQGGRWQDVTPGQGERAGDFDPSVDHVFGGEQPFDEEESRLGRGLVILGWIGLVALLGALGSYLYLGRTEVVRLLPGTAGLYASAGLPVNVRGLVFKDVTYRWQLDRKGRPAITVEGQVTNVSERARSIPSVVIVFRDENELKLFDWATPVRFASLPPGQSTGFSATVPAPPEAVRSLLVHFARQRR